MQTELLTNATERFLGQWQRLVSTTNWDKGRIICAWRESLADSGAPSSEYTDETWSRNVGNVSSQHVGRLRRTWERFSAVREEYAGLYWSHFQAATDWDDAEMWLEGAVQNSWSVADMRRQRASTLGLVDAPAESAPAAIEWDQDADDSAEANSQPGAGALHEVRDAGYDGSNDEAGETDANDSGGAEASAHRRAESLDGDHDDVSHSVAKEQPRPFADLPSLPADLTDAFESFKLCVLRHKMAGWRDISRDAVLLSLDALRELALATAG